MNFSTLKNPKSLFLNKQSNLSVHTPQEMPFQTLIDHELHGWIEHQQQGGKRPIP